MKICTHWHFRLLISNTRSDFRNSKWWIQYGRKKFRKISYFYKNLYIGVFEDADYESAVRFWKFKMAVLIFRSTIKKKKIIYIKSHQKFVYSGFLGRWFRIRCQYFQIQNGETKFFKISNFYENSYMTVFGDADYESAVRFWKFKMAVLIWQWICNQRPKNRIET